MDPFNLNRFISAQDKIYDIALDELKRGRKESHWIWFIFPQIEGLGESSMSIYYSIKSLDEAKDYTENKILWKRYLECLEALLSHNEKIDYILGGLDSVKLLSSLTLFSYVSEDELIKKTLDKFYPGRLCEKTKQIINKKYKGE